MFEKLQEVEKRYEEVNELICKPKVIADMEQYTKLMKENKHLEPVVEKFREYKKTKETYEESKEMLGDSSLDDDFAQMVKEEFEQDRKIDEQDRKIDEQKRMLQNAIEGLRKQGMDDTAIASILGLSADDFDVSI